MTAALSNSPVGPQKTATEEAYDRAMGLQIAGQLTQAEAIYRSILESQPTHAGAHYCLGMLLVQRQRPADASPHLLAAVNHQPQIADYWLGYLEALLLLGEKTTATEILTMARQHGLAGQATEDFARRLAMQSAPAASAISAPAPDDADAIQRKETAVMALVNDGLFREALPLAREMTERFPTYGNGWKILGAMLWSTGREREAIEAMQMSVRFLPNDAEAHKNLASAINGGRRLNEAEHYLRRALQIDPNCAQAHLVLGHNYQLQGRYAESRASLQAAIAQSKDTSSVLDPAHSLLLFVLNNDPSADADTLFAEHRKVGALIKRIERSRRPRRAHDRDPDRCLQVGFVSADLYNHSVAHFIEPLLSTWQGSRNLQISTYYANTTEDAVSRRMQSYVSHWNPVSGLTNAQLEELVVEDGIDILIDLSGHTALHRLGAFARKPAPVQASWLGYPATTGLAAIDYYLADKHYLPPGQFDKYFTEKLVYLPSAWTFNPSSYAPPVNPLPALTAGHVTFGSFNRMAKLNEPTVRLWAQLMRATPASRMLIAGVPVDVAERQLIPLFENAGITRDRLSFHEFSNHEAHFALHHQVDIALESLPYSGCTTSNHALWMGVPSLTCVGTTPASRLCAANLGQLELDDFIAVGADDFVAKGVRWAGDLSALASLRASLRARWENAPARNAKFFAAGMELALRHMWRRWCAGLPAESFEISAAAAAAAAQ